MANETFLKDLNPNLPNLHAQLNGDYLYHLGLSSKTDKLRETFGDVGYVAMMGSGPRAFKFASELAKETGGSFASLGKEPNKDIDVMSLANEQLQGVLDGRVDLLDAMSIVRDAIAREAGLPEIIGKDERYWMFKVDTPAGGVISINHHMGQPTHSILLHETTKLLHHAEADRRVKPFEYFRLGTSGGLGIEGGDIVVADKGLDPTGTPVYKLHVLGEVVEFPTEFDPALVEAMFNCRDAVETNVVKGGTVSCDDFYTVQARRDGAFCMVKSEQDKLTYLDRLHKKGARNMEMEAAAFAAFCQKMGIPAVCVCTALLNRLNGDQVLATPAQLASFSDGPQKMLIEYIKRQAA